MALPKVGLHCHLEGAVRESTVRDLSARYHIALSVPDDRPLYTFADFGAFLRCFREVCTVLCEPADYGRILREYAADACAQNIRYAEVFISPAGWARLHPNLDCEAALAEIHGACADARAAGVEIRLIVDLTRNFGPEVALETTRRACTWQRYGVIGIGVGGDEAAFPGPLFASSFDLARAHGMHLTAHAGEAAGAASVRETVLALHVARIGHGVRAVEDPHLLAWLVERNIGFEQAPTSNVRTGAVANWAAHPMSACVTAGLRVAIDADDPALFGVSMTDELTRVADIHGYAFMCDRLFDAIDLSFAEPTRKAELRAELTTALANAPLRN